MESSKHGHIVATLGQGWPCQLAGEGGGGAWSKEGVKEGVLALGDLGWACMGLWLLWLHIIMGSSSHKSGPRHMPRGCCAPPSSTR